MDPLASFMKKLGMQSELHRNNMYQSAELLLLVPMLFLLTIPKCLLIFKVNFILHHFVYFLHSQRTIPISDEFLS